MLTRAVAIARQYRTTIEGIVYLRLNEVGMDWLTELSFAVWRHVVWVTCLRIKWLRCSIPLIDVL